MMGPGLLNDVASDSASQCDRDFVQSDQEQCDQILLPGLPDDLALQCLVRVPRSYHSVLSMVCKQWKHRLLSKEYYLLRKKMNLTEKWIYILNRDISEVLNWYVLDPVVRKWKKLPAMPGDCRKYYGMASAVLGTELYVLGGEKKFENPTSDVFKYDAITNKWVKVGNLQCARSFFVCTAFQDRLYAVGGMGLNLDIMSSWEVYDSLADCWASFTDPNIVADLGESLVIDGKLYIRDICMHRTFSRTYAALYYPSQNTWSLVDNEMTRRWCGTTAVDGNDVYMLDQTYGLKLLVLDNETFTWNSIGRLSPKSLQTPCRVATVGGCLYVVGKGLRTTVLNVDKASRIGGTLVTSSIQGPQKCSDDDLVLSCQVLEI